MCSSASSAARFFRSPFSQIISPPPTRSESSPPFRFSFPFCFALWIPTFVVASCLFFPLSFQFYFVLRYHLLPPRFLLIFKFKYYFGRLILFSWYFKNVIFIFLPHLFYLNIFSVTILLLNFLKLLSIQICIIEFLLYIT